MHHQVTKPSPGNITPETVAIDEDQLLDALGGTERKP